MVALRNGPIRSVRAPRAFIHCGRRAPTTTPAGSSASRASAVAEVTIRPWGCRVILSNLSMASRTDVGWRRLELQNRERHGPGRRRLGGIASQTSGSQPEGIRDVRPGQALDPDPVGATVRCRSSQDGHGRLVTAMVRSSRSAFVVSGRSDGCGARSARSNAARRGGIIRSRPSWAGDGRRGAWSAGLNGGSPVSAR